MVKRSRVFDFDAADLAAHILGISEEYEKADNPIDLVDNEMLNQFDITLCTFQEIVEHLLPLVTEAKSPLTGTHYRGFAADGLWLVKEQAG